MSSYRERLVRELQIPGMPAAVGPYADATIMGDQIFVSGLLALGPDGMVIGANDAEAQAEHILVTLETILGSVGSDLGDVAKLTLYLLDLDDRAGINAARVRAFGHYRPASTLVQVAGLIGQGTLVEIDAIAAARHSET